MGSERLAIGSSALAALALAVALHAANDPSASVAEARSAARVASASAALLSGAPTLASAAGERGLDSAPESGQVAGDLVRGLAPAPDRAVLRAALIASFLGGPRGDAQAGAGARGAERALPARDIYIAAAPASATALPEPPLAGAAAGLAAIAGAHAWRRRAR